MSKYGEALGVWELRVGGFKKNLHPTCGDNLELIKVMGVGKKEPTQMFQSFKKFMMDLIGREFPPENDSERKDLEEYVEFNLFPLLKETMIMFRWTTKEELDKVSDSDILKKGMLQL